MILFGAVIVICAGIAALAAAWLNSDSDLARFFRPFQIAIHNEAAFDIVALEAGIVGGHSTDARDMTIRSGSSAKLTPKLELQGEGAVYLKYTDSLGRTVEKTVCGYTEYLSGLSEVTVRDGEVDVEMDCY